MITCWLKSLVAYFVVLCSYLKPLVGSELGGRTLVSDLFYY